MPRLYDIAWTKPRRWSSAICGRWSTSASTPRARSSARSTRRRRARRRCAAGREGRGDRGLPAQFLRQSGARADAQGHHRAQGARPAAQHLLRGAARDQGVRAHLDDGDQRLRHADRRHLPARAAPGPRRARASRRALLLMQSNGGLTTDARRRRAADEHHRVRPGRRRGRRAGAGAREGARRRSSPSTWAARPPRPRWSRTAR